MTNLTGLAPSQTYPGLLTLDNNGNGLIAALRTVQDGIGQNSPLQLSLTEMNITGNTTFSGNGAITLPNGSTGQRPVPPANGMIRYNTTTNQLEAYINGAWQTLNAGGNANFLQLNVNQAIHGFAVGSIVYFNGTYLAAQANAANTADVVGIVVVVTDANNFTLQMGGYITNLVGLTPSTAYFLSPTVAGAMTATAPTTAGQIRKPLLISDSATTGFWLNYQGQQL